MGRPRLVSAGGRCVVIVAPARGEVWWCELAEIGRRPVVILSRDAAIPRLRRALVAPCTTTIRSLPSEVVSGAVRVERLGRLADARMREFCAALAVAVDCQP